MPTNHATELGVLRERMGHIVGYLDIDGKRAQLADLEEQAAAPGLWDDSDAAAKVTQALSRVKSQVDRVDGLAERVEDLETLNELAQEMEDADSATEVEKGLVELTAALDKLEVATLLSGEYDGSDALISIQAGEGGVDAMDWAHMLQRMYLRWAETHGYDAEIYDESWGEEAGIKSTTFEIRGPDAYGWLGTEHGVHRLVRISPFDSAARRQTGFALVDVVPVLPDVDTEIEVDESDLRIDVYRSSGPGGQSVNTTDSAVRITHTPSGIVASSQNEKSQHQNKAAAMRVLKTRLAELERQKREEELAGIRGGRQNVGFGSQIRSYVLAPYQMVKDLRTDHEVGNPEKVFDGSELDGFMEAELRRRATERNTDAS